MYCLLGSLNFLSLYQCALNLSGVCERMVLGREERSEVGNRGEKRREEGDIFSVGLPACFLLDSDLGPLNHLKSQSSCFND